MLKYPHLENGNDCAKFIGFSDNWHGETDPRVCGVSSVALMTMDIPTRTTATDEQQELLQSTGSQPREAMG